MAIARTAAAPKPNNTRAASINFAVWLIAGIVDYLNLAVLYAMNLSPALLLLLHGPLQYILFPIAAVASITYAYCAWRHYELDRNTADNTKKSGNRVSATVTTVSTLLILSAILLGAISMAAIPTVVPILIGINIILNVVFNFGAAAHAFLKASRTDDPEKKAIYQFRAVTRLMIGLTVAMTATAALLVAVMGITTGGAALGIAAGILGAVFGTVCLVRMVRDEKLWAAYEAEHPGFDSDAAQQEPLLGSTARLRRSLPTILTFNDRQENSPKNSINSLRRRADTSEDFELDISRQSTRRCVRGTC